VLPAYPPDQSLAQLPRWSDLTASDVRRWPLTHLPRTSDRILARLACLLALRQIVLVEGWERILPRHDPVLLVANHSSRREAVLLPALLTLVREGRPVRFLADWNFRLIPGVGYLYRRSGAITVTRKHARPRVLNCLRPLFDPSVPPYEQARRHLQQGGSLAIFPEGTVNRDGAHLRRGRLGAARLSLQTGVPVVPVGIRFARQDAAGQLDSSSPMSLYFGEALRAPAVAGKAPSRRDLHDWHGQLMGSIAGLCGKTTWGSARAPRPSPIPFESAAPPALVPTERGDSPC
jgi:1-acyl-sn-glycerol-3-phosphate acyltransferase